MKEYIDIYTDASWSHGCNFKKHLLGYAGIIFDEYSKEYVLNGTITRKTVKEYFNLGCSRKKISIHHGEIIAILKSLWQFRNTDKDIRIFSDSVVAMHTILKIRKSWNDESYKNLVLYAEKIINKIESNGGSVDFYWVKGHAGCVGNNLADKASKKVYAPKEMTQLTKKQKRKYNRLNSHKAKQNYINSVIGQRIGHLYDPNFLWEKEINQFKQLFK